MTLLEICLLIVGILAFAASFFIPEQTVKQEQAEFGTEQVKELIEKEIPYIKQKIEDLADAQADENLYAYERALEKLSNEKIMAVNEYSDNVLNEIHKNHTEVMFLYSMLTDKEQEVKDILKTINRNKVESQDALSKAEKMGQKILEIDKQLSGSIEQLMRQASILPKATQAENLKIAKEKSDAEEAKVVEPIPEKKVTRKRAPKKAAVQAEVKDTATEQEKQEILLQEPLLQESAVMEEAVLKTETVSQESDNDAPVLEVKVAKTRKRKPSKVEEILEEDYDDETQNKNDAIFVLHKEGLSNIEIAKQLKIGLGEVKLVLELFKGVKG